MTKIYLMDGLRDAIKASIKQSLGNGVIEYTSWLV